jgi:hypothetical protein
MSALLKMAETLGSLAEGMNPIRYSVRRTFECMDVAEQEIARALRLRSNASATRRARIQRAFLALLPPEQLTSKGDEVYRQHARELLQRAADGKDLRPGTDAEVLTCMLDCSLQAPPTALIGLACARLFEKVMGKKLGDDLSLEPWPGAVDELVADLRRKTSVPTRKLKEPA